MISGAFSGMTHSPPDASPALFLTLKTEIYYNPRCSKCRQTLALLREHGVDPSIVPYLDKPPGRNALSQIIRMLDIDPRDLVRFKEGKARELGLSRKDKRSQSAWIQILTQNPSLLERPIVIHGGKAAIGRPPENVIRIL